MKITFNTFYGSINQISQILDCITEENTITGQGKNFFKNCRPNLISPDFFLQALQLDYSLG